MVRLSETAAATGAQRLARFALELRLDDVPPEVVSAAKHHLLDALGCGLAASALAASGEGREVGVAAGGRGEASVLGRPARLPAPAAALANAMLCHALDYDDTHAESVCHVTTVVGPAALAAAEAAAAAGAELVAALVAGSEIVARLGACASGAFHERGFHPTSVCGVFGAAAATARLEGLDPDQTASALGLAGSAACGLFAYLDDGTATKPVHAGLAAQNGVLAARLAAAGAEGPPSVLESRFGLYRAFAGVAPDALEGQLADLGRRWETARIAYKAYPACHCAHGALGAAARLVAEHRPPAAAIRSIDVEVPPGPAVALVLEPAAEKAAPRSNYEAKFSLPFSLAALFVHGRVGLDTYADETLGDPQVLELARRVTYRVRDFGSGEHAFPGAVRLVLDNGRELQAELEFQQGAPENPLSDREVCEKFRANAGLALARDAVDALLDGVLHLDERDDVGAALSPLRRGGG
jgi:2-methylcitrate dehydratase PrpD